MHLRKNIKTTSFKALASLACFTGGANELWGNENVIGVVVATETGSVDSCTDCNPSSSTHTCCTFFDALSYVGAFTYPGPTTAKTIDLTQIDANPHEVTYTGTINSSNVQVYGSSITINGGNDGGIINFNGVGVSDSSTIDFEVGLNSKVILNGTVFQNTTTNGHVIFNNGTLQINGTSANGHLFSNVAWDMGAANSTVSLIFGVSSTTSSSFSNPFPGNILIGAGQANSTLLIGNSSGSNVTISGDITYSDGASILTIYPSSAGTTLTFTGDMGSNTSSDTLAVNINTGSGTVTFNGTNEIDSLNLYGSTLSVPTVNALGGSAVALNFLGGALDLTAAMTLPNTIDITVATYQSSSTSNLFTTGTTDIQGSITGETGSTLSVFPSGALTFSGDLDMFYLTVNSGTGSVTLSGTNSINNVFLAGTLIVSTTASLGNGSTGINFEVTDGELQVSGGLNLANTINVTDGEGLLNTTSGTTTFSGTIFGGNAHTLSLTGSNSISTVNVGTTSSGSADTFTINGVIVTGQTLKKTGSGILQLIGTSTYSNPTDVEAGALNVTGSIASSDVLVGGVGSPALLLGTGTVGNTTVASDAAIKGGTTFGTLSVNGTLDLEDGSAFGVAITPGTASLVTASGSVAIGNSTLAILFQPTSDTYSLTSPITILTGSNITGAFSSVDVNTLGANFLTADLVYTSTTVSLSLDERSVSALAAGGNALQVASGLDGAIAFNRANVAFTIGTSSSSGGFVLPSGITVTGSPTPQLADVLISLAPLTTETEMTYALNQLHPAQTKGMAITQENNAVRVRESLSQRMDNIINLENCFLPNGECCDKNEEKMMTAWISGLGDTLVQDNHNNYWGPLTGYRANTGGFVTGFDTAFADYFYAGVLGAYTHSHLHYKDGKGTGNINTGYAGVYFSAFGKGPVAKTFYTNLSVIGGWSGYNGERHIEYSDVNLVAKNSHGGSQVLSHIDTGLNLDCLGLTIRPFDSFDYISQTENKYKESNASEWELTVHEKNAIMIRNELGLQFAKCFCMFDGKWIVTPKFSWVREVRIKGDGFSVNFTQGGTPFFIEGYFPDRNLFVPGLALTGMMLKDTLVFDLYYNGEFTGGYSSNSFGGQVGYSF